MSSSTLTSSSDDPYEHVHHEQRTNDDEDTEDNDDDDSIVADDKLSQDPKVVGGVEAKKRRYPYMVNVLSGNMNHMCGGSLISPDLILSASHCGNAKYVEVGRYDLSDENEDYQLRNVTKVCTYCQ